MTVDTSIVLARMQAVGSAVSSLGPALEAAAPTGEFQAALDEANAALAQAANPSAPSSSTSGTAGAGSGAVLSAGLDAGALGAGPDDAAPGGAGLGSGLDPLVAGSSLLTPSSVLLGLSTVPGSGTSPAVSGGTVVNDAEQYLGVPYRWGGTDPSTGLDCSGLVQRVYGDLGITLPRTSQEQATTGTPVASLAAAQPGDLVFFEPSASGPGHVGIYIGNGEMIDAPHTGTDVQVQRVGQPSEIRRVLPGAEPADAASDVGAIGTAGPGLAGLQVPASLAPLLTAASARHGVPASLLAAVAKQESGFNPNAVSPAGAEGLMQLMPSTAAGLGVNAFDPAQALDGAARLLGGYLQQYNGSVPMALAAYNAGPGAVARYGGVPPYPETTAYVDDILRTLGAAS